MAPPSQKFRDISFYLEGGAEPPVLFTFAIRPEELTRPEPSRLTAQNTLGGAWVDSFDQGLPSITLSGHNGWRGGLLGSGEDLYQQLRSIVYVNWHARRQRLVSAGQDPNQVTLTMGDALDGFCSIVAPKSFQLHRSRSRPLLMMYTIQLIDLGPASNALADADAIEVALSDPLRWVAGYQRIATVVGIIQAYASSITAYVTAINTAVQSFVASAVGVFQSIAMIAQQQEGVFTQLQETILTAGSAIAVAGANAFSALAADAITAALTPVNIALGIPAETIVAFQQIASAFTEVGCVILNTLNLDSSFPAYPDIFGASNCSSTSGGDPPSPYEMPPANAFGDIFAIAQPPVTVTAAAASSLAYLATDPILLQGQQTQIGSAMSTVASGIEIDS